MTNAIESIRKDQVKIWESFRPHRTKIRLSQLYGRYRFWQSELRSCTLLSWRDTWRAWRHGLKRSDYRYYVLERGDDPQNFISSMAGLRQGYINGRYHELLGNKLTFALLMEHLDAPMPAILGVIHQGRFHAHDTSTPLSPDELLKQHCTPGETLVFKAIWGAAGRGFFIVQGNEQGYRVNHEPVDTDELMILIDELSDYLVTEFARQASFAAQIYPRTTNTIRLITLQDPNQSGAFILGADMRFGTAHSGPTDHPSHGGLSSWIDPDTGILQAAAEKAHGGALAWHTHHPDTGVPIEGTPVPGWSTLRSEILSLSNRLAYIPNIGWDIVPGDDGFVIIEMNGAPSLSIQVHGPLLTDPRVRRYYEHHGMV